MILCLTSRWLRLPGLVVCRGGLILKKKKHTELGALGDVCGLTLVWDEGGPQKRNCGAWPWSFHPSLALPSSNQTLPPLGGNRTDIRPALSLTESLPTESWPLPWPSFHKQEAEAQGCWVYLSHTQLTHNSRGQTTVRALQTSFLTGAGPLMDLCEVCPLRACA